MTRYRSGREKKLSQDPNFAENFFVNLKYWRDPVEVVSSSDYEPAVDNVEAQLNNLPKYEKIYLESLLKRAKTMEEKLSIITSYMSDLDN